MGVISEWDKAADMELLGALRKMQKIIQIRKSVVYLV